MSAKLALLTSSDLYGLVAHRLGCTLDTEDLSRALAAEHIRAHVYGNSCADEIGSYQPIHTTRLFTNLRRNLTPHVPEQLFMSVLRDLQEIGDVVHLGKGYWVAGPLQAIDIGNDHCVLIVGGVPTALLGDKRLSITCSSAARFAPTTKSLFEQAITVDRWQGYTESLGDWTATILRTWDRQMAEMGDLHANDLEVYAPDFFLNQGRIGRWVSATDVQSPLNGLRLCRPRTGFLEHDRPSFLVRMGWNGSELTLKKAARVEKSQSLRLRFGLDQLLNSPRTATCTTTQHICTLSLRFPLPEPEARVLRLGWHGKERPELINFHVHLYPLFSKTLDRLGIRII